MTNIKAIDLNLLVILDAVLRTSSVSAAAKSVGLSQPAVSAALGRLRVLLKDPLFVRSSKSMFPTPRALELREPVAQIIASIEKALFGGIDFNPGTSELAVRLSVDDYTGHTFLSSFLADMQKLAPSIKVECVLADSPVPHKDLVSGDLDIAVRVNGYRGAGIFQKKILDEKFLCISRRQHPKLKSGMTLKTFVELKHILVSPFGGMSGSVDEALALKGLKRDVVSAVPHFGVAPLAVAVSDLIATLPARIAKTASKANDLQTFEPPIEVPGFSMFMLWHDRTHRNPGHRWIRERLQRAAESTA